MKKGRVNLSDPLAHIAVSGGIILVSSAIAYFARPLAGEVSGALIFVLGITVSGSFSGLFFAMLTAMISFILYNFYFAEPILTFRLKTWSDFAPLVIFHCCGLISGVLAGRMKDLSEAKEASAARLTSLLETSRALQSAVSIGDIQQILARSSSRLILPRDEVSAEEFVTSPPKTIFRKCNSFLFAIGARGLSQGSGDIDRHLEALEGLSQLAAERAQMTARASRAESDLRFEKMQSALLSSISHDIRTPLATISASASSLIKFGDQLDDTTHSKMLASIMIECDRLDRFTSNIIELSRITSGDYLNYLDTLILSDVIESTIRQIRRRQLTHNLTYTDDGSSPIVLANAAIFELTLANILENSIIYSPPTSNISIYSFSSRKTCHIEIRDEGRGLEMSEQKKIFDRFYRGSRASGVSGTGLGLAIAKGFVEGLGGTIAASTPGIGSRGCCISIALPVAREED